MSATKYQLAMEVNKKENGEYKKVGVIDVAMFSLDDFGLNAGEVKTDSSGLPVYADDKVQYVQDCVIAAIKAAARNKLISGTVSTKAGTRLAVTVAELMESGGNNGAALALHRDFVNAFTSYLTISGKSTAVQALYSGLVKAKQSIALSTEARRQGLAAQLENFLATISDDDQNKYMNIVEGLASLCEDATDLDDSEL